MLKIQGRQFRALSFLFNSISRDVIFLLESKKSREMEKKKKRTPGLKKQWSYKNWNKKGAFLVQQNCRSTVKFVLLIVILHPDCIYIYRLQRTIEDEHQFMFTDFTADRFELCEEQQQQRQTKWQHSEFNIFSSFHISLLARKT